MTEQEAMEVLKQPCLCDYDLSKTVLDCDIKQCDKRDAVLQAIKALEEICQYREIKERLKAVYGECDGLLETAVDQAVENAVSILEKHEGIDIGDPYKSRLLTDEDVDKWEAYKAIGTPEEIKQKLSELERWHTTEVNPKIKNVFANTSTLICHNCDHKDEYIEELEVEIEEYREIGTPKDFMATAEKQKVKKPIRNDKCTCPSCGTHNEVFKKRRNTVAHDVVYCWRCGQAVEIDRLEE